MSEEIDIRQTLSYSGVWTIPELRPLCYYPFNVEVERPRALKTIRFRVADDLYICYSAEFHRYIDDLCELRDDDGFPYFETYRDINVQLRRDESCELFPWNALISHEDYSCGFNIKTVQHKSSVDERFGYSTKIKVTEETKAMKFTIKFIIGAKKDVAKEKEMGDEMVSVSKAWFDAVKKRITTDVRLIGKDGTVDTKMELLMALSPAFEAMFTNKLTKEYIEKEVELKDFPMSTLEAFVKFLEKCELHDGNNNACDLLLLADKYNIPSLKSRAEQFLLNNVTADNAREIHKVFTMVSPNLLEELFVKTAAKK